MGDSHHGLLDSRQNPSERDYRPSYLPPQSPQGAPPSTSSVHFAREHSGMAPININGSTYYPEQQNSLVHEHTAFGRPLAPQTYLSHPHALQPTHYMASSLPLRLSHLYQPSHPEYLVQQSMVAMGQSEPHSQPY
jgi:hypothetical protein